MDRMMDYAETLAFHRGFMELHAVAESQKQSKSWIGGVGSPGRYGYSKHFIVKVNLFTLTAC